MNELELTQHAEAQVRAIREIRALGLANHVLVCGSYAQGTWKAHSDIDIRIVVPSGEHAVAIRGAALKLMREHAGWALDPALYEGGVLYARDDSLDGWVPTDIPKHEVLDHAIPFNTWWRDVGEAIFGNKIEDHRI